MRSATDSKSSAGGAGDIVDAAGAAGMPTLTRSAQQPATTPDFQHSGNAHSDSFRLFGWSSIVLFHFSARTGTAVLLWQAGAARAMEDLPYDDLEYDEDEDEGEEDDWDSDEESDAELDDITNLELEFPLEDAQKAGKREYLKRCAELNIVPIALFIAKMEAEHIVRAARAHRRGRPRRGGSLC